MISIAVCDDEPEMLAALRDKVSACMRRRNRPFRVDSFSDCGALLQSRESYRILFLDIKMEGVTGLEAARRLRAAGVRSFLVFVTALEEFVFDAFELGAADYLLKPIDTARLERVMSRILTAMDEAGKDRLLIQRGNGCRLVPYAQILYCEAISRKIYVHTAWEVIDYYCRIKELEELLDGRFFKCHRSYLLNLQAVRGYSEGTAELENGGRIPVSRLREQEFMQALLHWMKEE